MKNIIFSALLLISINANAICTNATVKGVYDVVITNPDKTIIKGAFSFDGLSNITFPYSLYKWGNFTTTIFPNGIRSNGSGAYYFDKYCKLSGFGRYVYNGKAYDIQLTTNTFLVSGAYAISGTGKFNQAKITFKRR